MKPGRGAGSSAGCGSICNSVCNSGGNSGSVLFAAALAALLSAGCQAVAKPELPDGPAVLEHTSAAGRSELQSTVAGMLHLPSVLLAEDALLHDSLLVLEKNRPRDARGVHGVPLSGRDFDQPEQFQLLRIDGRCVLLQLRTGRRASLTQAQCRLKAATPP